jgi:hypothetical protein
VLMKKRSSSAIGPTLGIGLDPSCGFEPDPLQR